tara:strand:+ start:15035 stop:16816 length:1782 start_codon:yes stop_codon:yes gene_type:complete
LILWKDRLGEFQVSEEAYRRSQAELDRLQEANTLLDRQIFDLSALLKAGEALHNELQVDALCRLLVAMVGERTQIEQMAVLLHDLDEGVVKVAYSEGLPAEVEQLSFPDADGILWRLLVAGDPFSVVDIRGEPRFPRIFGANQLERLRSQTWLPLVMPGEVIGVLSLGLDAAGRPVTDEQLPFLSSLASQAGVAINTARLYQRIAVARARLDRSLHQLSLLFDVTRALGAVSDLTGLLRLILERAIAAVGAEKGSLMLLDDREEELVVRVVFGLPDKAVERRINDGELECRRFRRGEGVAGWVLETGKALRVDNTDSEANFTDAENSHVQSILCVPLTVDDETIGVINITNRLEEGNFGAEDEEILGALADQAAVAIARARLYEAAITDGLTGLYVRRFAMHRLREELRRARRYGNELTVVMCDIDHFKQVNDNYGHPAGDAVLIKVAEIISGQLRTEVDVAGRFGGEEFLLVLPETRLSSGVVAAERLRSVIEATEIELSDGRAVSVTMSFGLAQFDVKSGEQADAVIARADAALYESKESGRNRITAHGLEGEAAGSDGDLGGFSQAGDTLRKLQTLNALQGKKDSSESER